MGTEQFGVWVTKLGGRVRALEAAAPHGSLSELEREANTCEAEVSHLFDYALQHMLELAPYYFALSDIESRLSTARSTIEARRVPWWQKVVPIIARAIGLVLRIVGLGIPRLRSGN